METNILLNALALGPMTSGEIGLLVNSTSEVEYEKLSEVLCGVRIPNDLTKKTLNRVLAHQKEMSEKCGRGITIKSAAMDYLESRNMLSPGTMSVAQLSRMAFYDELTKAANYRYFTMKLSDEACRSKRYKRPMSLIMTDIDRFKAVNDLHGHEIGNEILKSFVNVIKTCVRDTDFVARYGGEEFAVLLPETSKKEAIEIAERIRVSLENRDVDLGIKITASFGVSTFGRDTFEKDHLVLQADESLYKSKRKGRNRTTAFDGSDKFPGNNIDFYFNAPDGWGVRAAVVGSFNNWESEPMEKVKNKQAYHLRMRLAPGTYEYKFYYSGADGSNDGYYIEDKEKKETTYDGYGGHNSILVVS